MLSGEVIAIDFETTGLSPAVDRATEVAAVRLVGGSIVDRYQTLINAGIAVPPHVTALTGISTQMLHGAPSPGKVFRELRDFIGDLPVVAHHATFDNGFYRMELERAGIRSDPEAS